MRSIVRIHGILGLLACAALSPRPAVAQTALAPALAGTITSAPLVTFPTVACATPTLAQCTSSAAYRQHACFTLQQATCRQLVAAAGARATAAAATSDELVVMPEGIPGAGTLRPTHRLPFNEARLGAPTGTALGFDAQQLPFLLGVRRAAPVVVSQRLAAARAVAPQRPTFEQDGAAIKSCQEFVYEKYYDLSRFREGASACRDDADCVAALAFDTTGLGLDKPSLRSKSGVAFATQLRGTTPAATRPKNAFFGVDPSFLTRMPEYLTNATFRAKANAVVAARRVAAPYTVTDLWAFHRQMRIATAAAALSRGEREDIARRTSQLRVASDRLLQTDAWIRHIDAAAQNPQNVVIDPRCLSGAGSLGVPACSQQAQWAPGAERQAAEALQAAARAKLAAVLFAEWDHVSPRDGVTVDRGCLDTASNRCDWSPGEALAMVGKTYDVARERDLSRCIDATGDNFTTAIVNPAERISSEALDAALAGIAARNRALAASLPRESSTNPRARTVGGGLVLGSSGPGESQTVGDPDYFSVRYNYGSRWSVGTRKNANNAVCGLDGEMNAFFHADAQVLSSNAFEVVDAVNLARVGRPELSDRVGSPPVAVAAADAYRHVKLHSHLRVVGADVYDPVDVSGLGPQETRASFQKTLAALRFEQTVFLAFIPITLGAAVDVIAGIDGSLSGTPAALECDPNALAFDVRGSVEPWVRADASAWVGVDIFFAEAGVIGKLNLIRVGVPITGGLRLEGAAPTANLALHASANLDVQALSGGLYGYVDLFGARVVEEPIFTWDGLRWQKPLFALQSTLPMTAVSTLR